MRGIADNRHQGMFGISIAVLIAGSLIALSLYGARGTAETAAEQGTAPADAPRGASSQGVPAGLRLPSEDDHIRGNPEAPVAVIEFSDFECPFCARLHPTLTRIVAEDREVK